MRCTVWTRNGAVRVRWWYMDRNSLYCTVPPSVGQKLRVSTDRRQSSLTVKSSACASVVQGDVRIVRAHRRAQTGDQVHAQAARAREDAAKARF